MPTAARTSIATTFDPVVAAAIDEIVEHVNGHHDDTIALVALGAATQQGVVAQIVGVDPEGVSVDVGRPPERTRHSFAEPVSSAEGFQAAMFTALIEARDAVGDAVALTSLELELARDAIPMHQTHVVSSHPLTPTLLEVVVGGLGGFAPIGPDTFVYALVTNDGTTIDADLTMARYLEMDETSPIRGAYYTVRSWDPDRAEATLWVVLHDADDGVAAWMARARPEDRLLLWGPRMVFTCPPEVDHLLVVVDETGLAAAAAIIEDAPSDLVIHVVAATPGPKHRPAMPTHVHLTVQWIDLASATSVTGADLVDAVSSIDMASGTWAAFGGAESRQISAVRRLLRDDRDLPAERVSMTGYWRFKELD